MTIFNFMLPGPGGWSLPYAGLTFPSRKTTSLVGVGFRLEPLQTKHRDAYGFSTSYRIAASQYANPCGNIDWGW